MKVQAFWDMGGNSVIGLVVIARVPGRGTARGLLQLKVAKVVSCSPWRVKVRGGSTPWGTSFWSRKSRRIDPTDIIREATARERDTGVVDKRA